MMLRETPSDCSKFLKRVSREINKLDKSYRTSFIDYERLRKQVKKIVYYTQQNDKEKEKDDEGNGNNNNINNNNLSINNSNKVDKAHSYYWMMLVNECERVNQFFAERERYCIAGFDELQLDVPSTSNSAAAGSAGSSATLPPVHPVTSLTFARVLADTFAVHAQKILSPALLSSCLSIQLSDLDPRQVTLFKRFLLLCYEVDQLRKYVVINYLIIWRAVKKYEGNTKSNQLNSRMEMSKRVEEYLKGAGSGWSSVKVAKLVSRAHTITDRLLNKMNSKSQQTNKPATKPKTESANGDGVKMESDKGDDDICPLCSDPLDKPVVLSCSHRFCFNCLTRQPCFGSSCPSCKQEQDIDTQSLSLDSVLARFIEIHLDSAPATISTASVAPAKETATTNPTIKTEGQTDADKTESQSQQQRKQEPTDGNESRPASDLTIDSNRSGSSDASTDSRPPSSPPPLQVQTDFRSESFARTTSETSTCSASSSSHHHSHAPPPPPLTSDVSPSSSPSPTSASSPSPSTPASAVSSSSQLKKRGQGVSCHVCKTTKDPHLLLFCTNKAGLDPSTGQPRKRRCRKKYCEQCLKRAYTHAVAESVRLDPNRWRCPSCLLMCLCASCQRIVNQMNAAMNGTAAATNLSGIQASVLADELAAAAASSGGDCSSASPTGSHPSTGDCSSASCSSSSLPLARSPSPNTTSAQAAATAATAAQAQAIVAQAQAAAAAAAAQAQVQAQQEERDEREKDKEKENKGGNGKSKRDKEKEREKDDRRGTIKREESTGGDYEMPPMKRRSTSPLTDNFKSSLLAHSASGVLNQANLSGMLVNRDGGVDSSSSLRSVPSGFGSFGMNRFDGADLNSEYDGGAMMNDGEGSDYSANSSDWESNYDSPALPSRHISSFPRHLNLAPVLHTNSSSPLNVNFASGAQSPLSPLTSDPSSPLDSPNIPPRSLSRAAMMRNAQAAGGPNANHYLSLSMPTRKRTIQGTTRGSMMVPVGMGVGSSSTVTGVIAPHSPLRLSTRAAGALQAQGQGPFTPELSHLFSNPQSGAETSTFTASSHGISRDAQSYLMSQQNQSWPNTLDRSVPLSFDDSTTMPDLLFPELNDGNGNGNGNGNANGNSDDVDNAIHSMLNRPMSNSNSNKSQQLRYQLLQKQLSANGGNGLDLMLSSKAHQQSSRSNPSSRVQSGGRFPSSSPHDSLSSVDRNRSNSLPGGAPHPKLGMGAPNPGLSGSNLNVPVSNLSFSHQQQQLALLQQQEQELTAALQAEVEAQEWQLKEIQQRLELQKQKQNNNTELNQNNINGNGKGLNPFQPSSAVPLTGVLPNQNSISTKNSNEFLPPSQPSHFAESGSLPPHHINSSNPSVPLTSTPHLEPSISSGALPVHSSTFDGRDTSVGFPSLPNPFSPLFDRQVSLNPLNLNLELTNSANLASTISANGNGNLNGGNGNNISNPNGISTSSSSSSGLNLNPSSRWDSSADMFGGDYGLGERQFSLLGGRQISFMSMAMAIPLSNAEGVGNSQINIKPAEIDGNVAGAGAGVGTAGGSVGGHNAGFGNKATDAASAINEEISSANDHMMSGSAV